MSLFLPFAQGISQQFAEMSKHELYVLDVDPDALWEHYLASFPEGTNPVFRERTEHDCSTCRQFVKRLGAVVRIDGDRIESVWDVEGLDAPYDTVAQSMREYLDGYSIRDLFRTKESVYGCAENVEVTETGTLSWNHFVGHIAARHRTDSPEEARGQVRTSAQVFQRALDEILADAITTVVDLIKSDSIYRGAEHLPAVSAFSNLHNTYHDLDEASRPLFVWSRATDPAVRFRNTVIGTLLTDLSEGRPVEQAVKSFEDKVAPMNYKRPKPVITQRMVEQAMDTIHSLDLEVSLSRRHATLSDLSVNDVLFVDNVDRRHLKDGIEGLLLDSVSYDRSVRASDKDAESISIDDFVKDIVPKAKSMDLWLKNDDLPKTMSLTTASYAEAPLLFRWDNPFAWSYDGEMADSDLRARVQELGGRVDGVLRFSLAWNHDGKNQSLMDLHVFLPTWRGDRTSNVSQNDNYGNEERVGWNRRQHFLTGGTQDVDNVDIPGKRVPVENITFPSMDKLPEGQYVFKIHNWNKRSVTTSGFKAEIECGGQVYRYEYPDAVAHKEWITVARAVLKDGSWTMEHVLPSGSTPVEKWGVTTHQATRVVALTKSPNHWGDNASGNAHWFFFLEGASNPAPTRGIYNEFLRPELEKHKRVFEVLGNKTLVQPAPEQMTGVGFSGTRRDTALAYVRGPGLHRSFAIQF